MLACMHFDLGIDPTLVFLIFGAVTLAPFVALVVGLGAAIAAARGAHQARQARLSELDAEWDAWN